MCFQFCKFSFIKNIFYSPEDVQSITVGKLALKYSGPNIEAMKAIAKASHNRSLHDFQDAFKTYKTELTDDPIINAHSKSLYDTMLEQNLCRIIEPYSRVQVFRNYIRERFVGNTFTSQVELISLLIKLSKEEIEKKLSQMILDKKFSGILDQFSGVLIIFEDQPTDKTYTSALDTIHSIGKVVDSLYQKAKRLS